MTDAESDEECTADYGVFGNSACSCSGCNPTPRKISQEEINRAQIARARRDAENRVSSNFNRHMIELYNSRSRP